MTEPRGFFQQWAFGFWLTARLFKSGRSSLNASVVFSLAGLTLGVAFLVVAMGLISGFESTLGRAITDVFGHVLLVGRDDRHSSSGSGSAGQVPAAQAIQELHTILPELVAAMPYVQIEGLIAHQKRTAGVAIQGVDPQSVEQVLNIRNRVTRGEFKFGKVDDVPRALFGKGLARKFNLEIGQTVKIVLPSPVREDATRFSPRVRSFFVGGILDLGKNEYDERVVLTDLKSAQEFADLGVGYTGLRLRLTGPEFAAHAQAMVHAKLGSTYWTMQWFEVNRNLLEAVKIERWVIFFVILVIVIAAGFNVSGQLFVQVLGRFSDIGILKTIGFQRSDILRIFALQGLFYGLMGTIAGLILGVILSFLFEWLQTVVMILPADVYKIDKIQIEFRFADFAAVLLASTLICLTSVIVPAWRGSRLKPVEGLRYE